MRFSSDSVVYRGMQYMHPPGPEGISSEQVDEKTWRFET